MTDEVTLLTCGICFAKTPRERRHTLPECVERLRAALAEAERERDEARRNQPDPEAHSFLRRALSEKAAAEAQSARLREALSEIRHFVVSSELIRSAPLIWYVQICKPALDRIDAALANNASAPPPDSFSVAPAAPAAPLPSEEVMLREWWASDHDQEIIAVSELKDGAIIMQLRRPNGAVVVHLPIVDAYITAVRIYGRPRHAPAPPAEPAQQEKRGEEKDGSPSPSGGERE